MSRKKYKGKSLLSKQGKEYWAVNTSYVFKSGFANTVIRHIDKERRLVGKLPPRLIYLGEPYPVLSLRVPLIVACVPEELPRGFKKDRPKHIWRILSCAVCHDPFIAKRDDAEYCSDKCRKRQKAA